MQPKSRASSRSTSWPRSSTTSGYDSDNENTFIDDQTLHEVYVAPFDAAVKADVSSIMCSYNRLNGTYACGNETTLTKILRDELGFKGFVTSDWGAVHARQLHQRRPRHGNARRARSRRRFHHSVLLRFQARSAAPAGQHR